MLNDAAEKEIEYHDQLNDHMGQGNAYKRARPYHCTLLAQTDVGLKNLFKLVSLSHLQLLLSCTSNYHVHKLKNIVKGLLIGSACDKGEVFEGMMQKGPEEVEEIAKFYDYLEVHPKEVYQHLMEFELIRDEEIFRRNHREYCKTR